MSLQERLVRTYDGQLREAGETVDREGLDWKYRPLDPLELSVWEDTHRDDIRVKERRMRDYRGYAGPPGSGSGTDGLPGKMTRVKG
ncbi:hypothetical protein BH10PSE12_BH10PSE12_16560 [soil metagenome]